MLSKAIFIVCTPKFMCLYLPHPSLIHGDVHGGRLFRM